ncbi:MAG: acetyl-CoA carboxylase carboxyltransferase subunit alpha [Chloroflexota bacterium]|nr:MAG: acetyl-CoA carboxylase carboxyltransferase subunit alpha [Chloroflexota bacterium]
MRPPIDQQKASVAWRSVELARHPERPLTLDYIRLILSDFVELHGDRRYSDDAALVGGLARFGNRTVVVIGHQKGRDTQENVRRNFGMPHPEGFRKAARLMAHAEKFGFPIISFIDTPGASPDMEAEERGQAQAIAENLLLMAQLRVPIIGCVIGEGNSGGALAIGVADRLLMLEHAYFSVVSPEGCASILWRDTAFAPQAAQAMRITAGDLLELRVVDEVIAEPTGGAHLSPETTAAALKEALSRHLTELTQLDADGLIAARHEKYRQLGTVLQELS